MSKLLGTEVTGLILRSPWPARMSDSVFERAMMTMLAVFAFLPYFLINWITLNRSVHDLTGTVDRMIAFDPRWEVVYVSIYFYLFVLVVWVRDPYVFRRIVAAFVAIQAFCFACFLLLPVGIERPELPSANRTFFEWGVALNYAIDHPRNLFPSLHLANAFMASLFLLRVVPVWGGIALVWATLIGYSTLAVKHHHFADVVAGVLVALVADRLMIGPAVGAVRTARGREAILNGVTPPWYAIAAYPLAVVALYGLWWFGIR